MELFKVLAYLAGKRVLNAEVSLAPSRRQTVGHHNPLYLYKDSCARLVRPPCEPDQMHERFSLAASRSQSDGQPTIDPGGSER